MFIDITVVTKKGIREQLSKKQISVIDFIFKGNFPFISLIHNRLVAIDSIGYMEKDVKTGLTILGFMDGTSVLTTLTEKEVMGAIAQHFDNNIN